MRVKNMKIAQGESINISQYPNFSVTGSIQGMRNKVYGKSALLVRCGRYIYHVPKEVYDMAC